MTRTTHSTSMNKEEINNDVTILFKIVNKLEQRIATLEKVLASHAKCIGEMRENNNDDQGNIGIITEERIRENKNES